MYDRYSERFGCRSLFQRSPATFCRWILHLDLFFHAIALSLDENGFGMMKQPVENGGCQGTIVVEDFRPVFKRAIGRDHQRALFVSPADDLEQKIGSDFVDG